MATSLAPSLDWVEPLCSRMDLGDVLGVLGRSPALFRKVLAAFPARAVSGRHSESSWSRSDVIAHMLDTETVMTFRIRKLLCEETPDLSFFDQEKWVAGLRPFRDKDPKKTAARFAAMRAGNVALLSALAPEQWKRPGVHPETGPLTLEELAARIARHDVNHLKQLIAG